MKVHRPAEAFFSPFCASGQRYLSTGQSILGGKEILNKGLKDWRVAMGNCMNQMLLGSFAVGSQTKRNELSSFQSQIVRA